MQQSWITPGRAAAWAATLAMGAFIGMVTLTPLDGVPVVARNDKLLHFAAFAGLSIPLAWAHPRWAWAVFLAATAYGGAIEIIQPYVGRGAEWLDWLADMAGAVAGALVGRWLPRPRARLSRSG